MKQEKRKPGRPKGVKNFTTNKVAGGDRKKHHKKNIAPKTSKKEMKERLLQELHNCYGVIKYACANAGCSREFFYKAIEDEEYRNKVNAVYDERIDDLEKVGFDLAVISKDREMIKFLLNNLAKKRGYNQPTEVKLEINKPLEIKYIVPEDDSDEK